MRETSPPRAKLGLRHCVHVVRSAVYMLLRYGWKGFRLRAEWKWVQHRLGKLTPPVYAGFIRPDKRELKQQRAAADRFSLHCRFGIVCLGTDHAATLKELHSSLTAQSYPEWTLLVPPNLAVNGLVRTLPPAGFRSFTFSGKSSRRGLYSFLFCLAGNRSVS